MIQRSAKLFEQRQRLKCSRMLCRTQTLLKEIRLMTCIVGVFEIGVRSVLHKIMAATSRVRYTRLPPSGSTPKDSDYRDEQFYEPPPKPPVKSILLAIFLFLVGSVLLTLGGLMAAGILGETEQGSTPILILGVITFLPGFYHVRIAYYAWKGYAGYSFADIPD